MANNFPNLRPSMNLDFVNGVYVDPRITFSRAGTRTYFGREMVKAEENLFVNSVWAGAATGTPGTVPTSWAAGSTGGTYTVTGAAIQAFAATGTRHFFSQTINVTTGTTLQITVDVDAVSGTGIDAVVLVVAGTATFTGTSLIDVAAGTGRKTITLTITGTGTVTVRFGAGVNSNVGSDCTVTMKAPQAEIRSATTAYTPTTTQPITRYQRQLKTAAANEWPREFDPVTGECLGRSVWEARTNLLLRSEEFDNAYWTKVGAAAVILNTHIAPNGTLTGYTLTGATSNLVDNFANMMQVVVTVTPSTIYRLSFFIKGAGSTQCRIQLRDASTGVLQTTTTNLTDGYQRVSVGMLTGAATTQMNVRVGGADGDVVIWGAMLEIGGFITPYIPTVASQVTRLADSAVMTGVNFSSWFNPSEGVLFVEAAPVSAAQNPYAAVVQQDNLATNYISLAFGTNNSFEVGYNGVTQAATTVSGAISSGVFTKSAGSYKVNDFRSSADGVLSAADTSGLVAANVNNLKIGAFGVNSRSIYIKRLTYYNQALTAANLQAITR